ncbi:MAG: LLM class F420-dependent oxidoreductase [Chloroflexota bacterium]|nr:LLM class F420-dependent oxidoreductase [Chloroflexota bacterium]
MKLGLQIPYYTYPGEGNRIANTFARIVQEAEAAGFYSVWVMDHFFQIESVGPKELEMLEAYSTLTYAAALTSRVKLGTLVTGVTYRYPAILLKTATTLDVLSNGRSYFGIGAAWNEVEHEGLGIPFPPLVERFGILEEILQLAHRMWSGVSEPFKREHLHLTETLNSPNALQQPHPPIMIGGGGEQKTFRLIAKYGDACNIYARYGMDYVRSKYAVLRERCEEADRPYNDIEKTTLSTLLVTPEGKPPVESLDILPAAVLMTPAGAIEYFHQLAEAGTDHAIFNTPVAHLPGALDVWAATIIPAVEKFMPPRRL